MTNKELIAFAEAWFTQQNWKAFPFQKQTWRYFLQGKHGLLNAPHRKRKNHGFMDSGGFKLFKKQPQQF